MKKNLFQIIAIACIFCTIVSSANAIDDNSLWYPLIEEAASLYDEFGDFTAWPEGGYMRASSILVSANILKNDLFQADSSLSTEEMQSMLLEQLSGDYTGFLNRLITVRTVV